MANRRTGVSFAIILLFCSSTVSCYIWTAEINIAQGKLKGTVDWLNGYKTYLGIPYASVTKRFQEAEPAPTWNGTLLATKGSIKCNQYSFLLNKPVGQEDCLVLNVFTPIRNVHYFRSVMVYIHGGGLYSSNTDLLHSPKYLIQKDVIIVIINYRLGAFGFLCLHETEAPGNIGLKDQIAALQWIKKNIQAFGGNPNTITVFGESAGAASIHYIITTGKYKGLFNKAILESGSVLMPNKIDSKPIKTASFVASKMGFNTDEPKELLKIFQNATANDIIEASHIDVRKQPLKSFVFRPCIERPVVHKESLITTNPRKLVESAKLDLNLHIILGYNNKEGILYAGSYDSNGLRNLDSRLSDLIPDNIKFKDESEKAKLTQEIRKFYFERGIDYDSLIDFFSDSVIMSPSTVSTNFLLNSNVTVYNYYFKYDSFRNLYKFMSGLPLKPGADHGDELFYLFDPIIYNLLPPTENDLRFIHTFTTLWTNFAKTGKPSHYSTVEWIQSKKDDLNFLQLDKDIYMIPLPNKERIRFWDQVYENYTVL